MGVSYAFDRDVRNAAKFYQQVFDREMATPDYVGAARGCRGARTVYLESGDSETALKWYPDRLPKPLGARRTCPDRSSISGACDGRAPRRASLPAAATRESRGNKSRSSSRCSIKAPIRTSSRNIGLWSATSISIRKTSGGGCRASESRPGRSVRPCAARRGLRENWRQTQSPQCEQRVLTSIAHTPNNAFARPMAKKKLGAGD